MISVSVVTENDDLEQLVAEINSAIWDEANEMTNYDVDDLRTYLTRQDTLFVACHDILDSGSRTLLGIASSRLEIKPYDKELWLYVDEVDVCADQRQRGAGKAIMRRLLAFAKESGCEEVWLGTEVDNDAANALYRSLNPEDESQFVGYTFGV